MKVKTFIGERKTYELQVPITATTDHLYQEVVQKIGTEVKNVSNPRFYYPMGYVKNLSNSLKTLSEFNIPDGASLIMMAKKAFQWGTERKPENLKVRITNVRLKLGLGF